MKDPCSGEGSTHFLACNCREREFKAIKDKLELAVNLLRHIEWLDDIHDGVKRCPSCKFNKKQYHAAYCKLQAFFKLNET